jgi:hypothetical protein
MAHFQSKVRDEASESAKVLRIYLVIKKQSLYLLYASSNLVIAS